MWKTLTVYTMHNLKDQFIYHPPRTKERIEQHETVNRAALNFAHAVASVITDIDQLEKVFDAIQIARMKANMAVQKQENVN